MRTSAILFLKRNNIFEAMSVRTRQWIFGQETGYWHGNKLVVAASHHEDRVETQTMLGTCDAKTKNIGKLLHRQQSSCTIGVT